MQEKLNLSVLDCIVSPWILFFKGFIQFILPFFLLLFLQCLGLVVALLPTFPSLLQFEIIRKQVFLFDIAKNVTIMNFLPENIWVMLVVVAFFALAGLLIFTYAFWEFLIYSAAAIKICDTYIHKKRIVGFSEVNNDIRERAATYVKVLLWNFLLCSIIPIVAVLLAISSFSNFPMFTMFLVVGGIATFYITMTLSLCTVVFVLNPEFKSLDCIVRSFKIVNSNFFTFIGVLVLLSITLFVTNLLGIVPFLGNLAASAISTPISLFTFTYLYEKLKEEKV